MNNLNKNYHPLFLEAINLPHDGTSTKLIENNKIQYFYNNQMHREDGPAYISLDEATWYSNGVEHREDGPASIFADGFQIWQRYNIVHRIDGPAIIDENGKYYWFIRGVDLSDQIEQWLAENNINYPFSLDNLVLFQMRWL